MPTIPATINGVLVEFSPAVNKEVGQRVIDALKHVVTTNVADGHALDKIYISSANDQHVSPSRHVMANGKAVDISRVNGKKMFVYYPQDPAVKAIVDALQDKFESYTHKRENFGPHLKLKLGAPHTVAGHKDHIHFSVN